MAKKDTKSFETALEALETIIYDLEGGTLTLAQSIKHYKKGMELAAFCSETLQQAEQQVYLLDKEGFNKLNEDIADE